MKLATVLVATAACLALTTAAHADGYVTALDPSGAAMCFDQDGAKAELALCQSYILAADPSGAPVCFDQDGAKAPLAMCGTYETRPDPSGAPMCFAQDGAKAPLAMCEARIAVSTPADRTRTLHAISIAAIMLR